MMTILKNHIRALRPQQWIKNMFIFAALIFVREFTDINKVTLVLLAFVLFCAAASGIYLINDLCDIERDSQHPKKKFRPIASGKVKKSTALIMAGLLLGGAIGSSFILNPALGWVIIGYCLLNIFYSLILKNIIIVDIISLALGFVLRVIAGAVVINVVFSPWLIFCTFFLTLFLAISKRKQELIIKIIENQTRPVLSDYSLDFLDQMNMIALPLTLMTYTLYTFFSEHDRLLMVTVPIVLYGLSRYLLLVQRKQKPDDGPTDDLLQDRNLQITILLWVITVLVILQFKN